MQQCINNAWVVQETCDYGCNSTSLTCNPKPKEEKICEEGIKRCLDNNLQECKNNTWTTIQTCNNGCNSTTLACNQAPEQVEKPKNQPINYWIIIGIIAVIIILAAGYYFGVYKKK